MDEKLLLVKNAMLATQRYPWEQGVCGQALYELGDEKTMIAMAHDAVLRQGKDGRLALMNEQAVITDPAANGEMVYRAYELTGDPMYLEAAEKMLTYLLNVAPKTKDGILCHIEMENMDGARQIWADSCYMAPPFLAVMGCHEEAKKQMGGFLFYLLDKKTHLLYHRYDAGNETFMRKKLWATGNGWALMALARLIDLTTEKSLRDYYKETLEKILTAMLTYQAEDGRFHDILDDPDSFLEGTSAMMVAAAIYRGVKQGWLSKDYLQSAEKIFQTMTGMIDEYGVIHGVAGCPDFETEGTSAESMASYLMMCAWREKDHKGFAVK